MGKEGPCYHCGIDHTPLWRNGPPEKPVLCNACGSRWRTRGTLNDYTPKHAMREAQNCQTDELPATDTDQFAASIGGAKNNNSGSGSNDTDGPGEPSFENLPKRRRSVLNQFVLTPVERLCKQLYGIAHENPEMYFKKTTIGDVLVDQANYTTSTPQETTLGAMLLAVPPKQLKVVETGVSSVAKMITTVSTSTKDNGNHSATEIGCDHGAHKDGDDHHTIEDDDDHGANKNGDRDTVEGGDDDSVTKNGGNHGT